MKQTAPDSPSSPSSGACQSKTAHTPQPYRCGGNGRRGLAVVFRQRNSPRPEPFRGDHESRLFRPQSAVRRRDRRQHGYRLRHRRAAAHDRQHRHAAIGRAELVAATPNKGGHRERAMGLIDQAIGELAPASRSPAADVLRFAEHIGRDFMNRLIAQLSFRP